MILELRLPLVSPHMSQGVVECLYAESGSVLKPGDKLLDLSIHLGANFAQDCPPISFFRAIVREKAVFRAWRVTRGQSCKPEEVLALLSTAPDESLDQPPQRPARIATAGIIHHAGMWTGNAS